MATFVCTSSHGQHTHSARTNLHLVVCTPPSCPPPWQFYQLLPKISFGCLTYNHIHISGLYSVLYMFRQTIAPFNVLCVCGISSKGLWCILTVCVVLMCILRSDFSLFLERHGIHRVNAHFVTKA